MCSILLTSMILLSKFKSVSVDVSLSPCIYSSTSIRVGHIFALHPGSSVWDGLNEHFSSVHVPYSPNSFLSLSRSRKRETMTLCRERVTSVMVECMGGTWSARSLVVQPTTWLRCSFVLGHQTSPAPLGKIGWGLGRMVVQYRVH